MKLLIVTQKVDKDDPVLGFFHRWIQEFSRHCDYVTVVCLFQGKYDLPDNVRVLSLGKEAGVSRLTYLRRFYHYIWRERHNYDNVFVHMNQEYILLGGFLWKILGKDVFMWRNHYAGNILTRIAGLFCQKTFCTSDHSYTASFKRNHLMPVGVDTEVFATHGNESRREGAILFLGRMSPAKKPNTLLSALGILKKKSVMFSASLYGPYEEKDLAFYQALQQNVRDLEIEDCVAFYGGIPHRDTADVYRSHDIFVNLSRSGMFDKTIFEAASSGCIVLTSSKDFAEIAGDDLYFSEGNVDLLAERLRYFLELPSEQKETYRARLRAVTQEQGIEHLVNELVKTLS